VDADGRSPAGYIERVLTFHVEHTEKPKRRALVALDAYLAG
jgi:hypothetical protein